MVVARWLAFAGLGRVEVRVLLTALFSLTHCSSALSEQPAPTAAW